MSQGQGHGGQGEPDTGSSSSPVMKHPPSAPRTYDVSISNKDFIRNESTLTIQSSDQRIRVALIIPNELTEDRYKLRHFVMNQLFRLRYDVKEFI